MNFFTSSVLGGIQHYPKMLILLQVSGELSKNGNPMRRFAQTFVLAAQSPTKFYVHNDIFRYQDYEYPEEELEEVENDTNINESVEREEEIEIARQEADKDEQQNQITTKIGNVQIGQNQIHQQPPQLNQQEPAMYYSMQPQAVSITHQFFTKFCKSELIL